MKPHKPQLATFAIRIDIESPEYPDGLKAGGKYYLSNFGPCGYYEIQEYATRIVENELKGELRKYTTADIREVKVQAEYEGSIVLVFTVLFKILDVASCVNDVLELVERISELHVKKRLREKFGSEFIVDTRVISPADRRGTDMHNQGVSKDASHRVVRDAFFYYLLVMNIILSVMLIALVSCAVWQVYFA